jgi:hypothetical protein
VVGIHLILDQLDNRQQQVGVPQPAENIIDGGEVLLLQPQAHLAVEVGQHHDGDIVIFFLYTLGQVKRIDISDIQHLNHQVDLLALHDLKGLPGCIGLDERRRVPQVQRYIFVEDLLIHAAILLQHKEIVVAADDQYFPDPSLHQQVERRVAKVDRG